MLQHATLGNLGWKIDDAFNQNLNVSQYASGNGINSSETLAIGRYVMFSMTYNIRGLKTDVRKGGFRH